MNRNIFEELNKINVNEYTEEKQGLTYLSWANAWAEFKKIVPHATYEIIKFEGKPYFFDENTGYMVYTRVTVDDQTHEMWLPVMNSNNKAMKSKPYTYKVKDYKTGEYVEKHVAPATMFDINKTIMRCLTKNLAMFGLGLYIYAGEDLPQNEDENPVEVKKGSQEELTDIFDGELPKEPMSGLPKCPVHGGVMRYVRAGVTKSGKPYDAFYACKEQGCKETRRK